MAPNRIVLSQDRRFLTLEWEDSRPCRVSAATLRSNCPSSRARRARLDGTEAPGHDDATIENICQIGRYAINVTFSDGHDRGIYPWGLLRDLANRGN